jgi:hypothetical protein
MASDLLFSTKDRKAFLNETMMWLQSFESDMCLVYIDKLNDIKIVFKDLYGKRSLLL